MIYQNHGILIINNANQRDEGTYVCVVENSVGAEKVETNLIITGKPTYNLIY